MNHSQTLGRLAERGGLDFMELLAVLTDHPWSAVRSIPIDLCRVLVSALVREDHLRACELAVIEAARGAFYKVQPLPPELFEAVRNYEKANNLKAAKEGM